MWGFPLGRVFVLCFNPALLVSLVQEFILIILHAINLIIVSR